MKLNRVLYLQVVQPSYLYFVAIDEVTIRVFAGSTLLLSPLGQKDKRVILFE